MSHSYTRRDLERCLLISAVVGVVLVGINQGPQALVSSPSSLERLTRIALDFVVPFVVASVSAVLANRPRPSNARA